MCQLSCNCHTGASASAAFYRRVLADFTSLVNLLVGQGWILEQVNVRVVARSAILHVLFDGLFVSRSLLRISTSPYPPRLALRKESLGE
jgi:hypothetical protein